MQTGCLHCTAESLGRRDFLRVGSLGFLGISLGHYLQLRHALGSPGGKAQACILLWLEGGPSQMDTWDPKPGSPFHPISTNVPGIQVSELMPRVARRMDKLALIRSMYTEENNHPQATYYALTGHRPNPAMEFPSFGAVITKERGARGAVPPHVLAPQWESQRQYEESFRAAFLGPECDPLVIPDPSAKDFRPPDLVLPKSITVERLEDRRGFLRIVDRLYRERVQAAEQNPADAFTDQARAMILAPEVRKAFDIAEEPDKVRDGYGRNGFGQSVLLARRLVEAGSRFVTAAGYPFNAWDTHGDNNKKHRDELVPAARSGAFDATRRSRGPGAPRVDDRARHGRVRSHALPEPGGRTRSLVSLLVARARRRRDPRRTGHWQERRARRLPRRRPQDEHRGPVRHRVQGIRHRLA